MTLPARMTAIAIRAPGGPEMLVPEERPVPAPGPGEILVKVAAAGVNRPDVRQRQGTYPPPKGATDIPGLEIAGEVAALGAGREALEGRRQGLRARGRRRLCGILPGLRAACAAGAACAFDGRGRGHSGDVLHLLAEHVHARRRQQRRLGAGARRHLRHRHDRDHAGQGVRRQGHHHRGLGGEMRGGQEARRRCRGQLQDRRLRRDDQGGDRRQGRQPDRRHRRRRLHRPQLRLPPPSRAASRRCRSPAARRPPRISPT